MPLVVNGETIDDALIRAEERTIRPRLYQAMEGQTAQAIETRVKEWARENVVERVLLRQAALEDPAGAADPEHAVERLLLTLTANVARPRNKDITEYYRKHREKLVVDEAVHASHILKLVDAEHGEESARAAIDEAARQLAEGAAFESLPDFADLGFLPRGHTVPEFERVIFSLAPGAVSAPFRSQFGFHIAKVHSRRPAGIPRLEEIRGQIEETLYQQKRHKLVEQFLDRKRSRSDIRMA